MFPTWRRLGAFIIDYFVVGIPIFLVAIGFFYATNGRVIPKLPIFHMHSGSSNVVEENKTTNASGEEVTNQACLSGYHPHPLYVVCTHFPE